MKTNRNEPCPCGSGNKYKNCCEQKRFQPDGENRHIRWLISGAIGFFLAMTLWGIVGYFSSDHPEMEPYTDCGNPTCTRIHYRPASQSN